MRILLQNIQVYFILEDDPIRKFVVDSRYNNISGGFWYMRLFLRGALSYWYCKGGIRAVSDLCIETMNQSYPNSAAATCMTISIWDNVPSTTCFSIAGALAWMRRPGWPWFLVLGAFIWTPPYRPSHLYRHSYNENNIRQHTVYSTSTKDVSTSNPHEE